MLNKSIIRVEQPDIQLEEDEENGMPMGKCRGIGSHTVNQAHNILRSTLWVQNPLFAVPLLKPTGNVLIFTVRENHKGYAVLCLSPVIEAVGVTSPCGENSDCCSSIIIVILMYVRVPIAELCVFSVIINWWGDVQRCTLFNL